MVSVENDDNIAVPVPSSASTSLEVTGTNPPSLSTSTTSSASVIPLPQYSDRVVSALQSHNIVSELDRMVEETAYHILKHGDMADRGNYEVFGRRLYEEFPCIAFPGAQPWVFSVVIHLLL